MVTAIQVDVSDSDASSVSYNSKAASSDDTKKISASAVTDAPDVKEQPSTKSRKNERASQPQQRRSRRNTTAPLLQELARHIVSSKPVVFITGAGLSAASGIRTFRGPDGLWSEVIWKKSTREEFRKDPLVWYNEFWVSVIWCNHGVFICTTNYSLFC
jgi:hypothetical protein